MTTDVRDDTEAREQARKRIAQRRELRDHAVVYFVVNAVAWAVWAITGAGYPWPVWISLPWGIGLVLHAASVYVIDQPITEADIDRELERERHRH